jgi:catechol 2,3-dioxygenase
VTVALRRTSLAHVALRTPNVTACATFYADVLGLVAEPADADGRVRLGWGAGHHALELVPGESGLDHVALEVGDDGGARGVVERAGLSASTAEEANALVVCDPDGNAVHLLDRVERGGEHTADPGRRPLRVQHVTFSTAALEPMVAFYVGLGLRLTDRMGEVFAWMRSNTEHHSVAVVETGRAGGLDHYSFDLDAWADFKVWADRLTDLGVPVSWGPGRHGPGNNLFLFFDDPDGNHIELSAEMERFFDERAQYPTRTWEDATTTVNLWGGQVPRWRTVGT